MGEAHRQGTVADRARDTLRRAGADVAGGEDAGPDGLEILVFGAPNLGENPRDDVEGQRNWWPE